MTAIAAERWDAERIHKALPPSLQGRIIVRDDGHLIWTAQLDGLGYAIDDRGRPARLTVYVEYAQTAGWPLPPGLADGHTGWLLHRLCRGDERACVNPLHVRPFNLAGLEPGARSWLLSELGRRFPDPDALDHDEAVHYQEQRTALERAVEDPALPPWT